ncbi:MAG: thermonuclease family protein [Patescibacteria group bacterium UBA2103]
MKPFSHKVIISALAFVAAAGGYGGYEVYKTYEVYGANFENRPHLVEEVVDGDTIIIENNIRVRLLTIDAPEINTCYGQEAKEYLTKTLLGKEIILQKDQTAKDSFDRLLRYVFIHEEDPEKDNIFVQSLLVENGYAKEAYTKPNRTYLSQIQADEREAKEEGRGLWGACKQQEEIQTGEIDTDPFSKECVIKGNITKSYTKDYFLPGCPNYKRVKIDPRKGEQYFCTEEEAQEAGYERSAACNNIWQTKE